MTTTTGRISVEYFLDEVIADRSPSGFKSKLSDHICEEGLRLWDETVDAIPQMASINQLSIAPRSYCDELDLPAGSNYSQCLAAALDVHPQFNGEKRLRLLQLMLEDQGLTEEVPFEV